GGGIGRTCQNSSRLRRATAPFTRGTPFNFSWRLHAAKRHPVTFPFGAPVFCSQAYQFFTLREYKMAPGQQNGHQSNNQFCQVPLMSQFFKRMFKQC
ncbi:hypothetical protein POY24_24610, partial [Klebsiella pneumoniae]